MFNVDVYGEEAKPLASIDRNPDLCPVCHKGLAVEGFHFRWISQYWLEGMYQCPNLECHHLFIAAFGRGSSGTHYFKYAMPFKPMPRAVDDALCQVSPEFAETYRQAWRAKDEQLMKIAGTGFRRALEFLVKDYASRNQNPGDIEAIQKKPLVQVIRDHIKEEGIRTVAERAAWLGNDETHYLRKWEDKDISDLIDLIDSVGHWIVIHLKTERLKASMLPKK
jgi:hypothetical protein